MIKTNKENQTFKRQTKMIKTYRIQDKLQQEKNAFFPSLFFFLHYLFENRLCMATLQKKMFSLKKNLNKSITLQSRSIKSSIFEAPIEDF